MEISNYLKVLWSKAKVLSVKEKTLLVIAHRLNTIQSANQIIVVNDGKITQAGTHEELMKKGGIYRDFADIRQRACAWMV